MDDPWFIPCVILAMYDLMLFGLWYSLWIRNK